MSNKRYPEEFKIEAVKQVTENKYPIAEVSSRLGVSQHSLYQWVKLYGLPESERVEAQSQQAELRRLKAELKRVTEERDILKNPRLGLRRFLSVEKHRRRVGVRQDCGRQLFGGLLTPSKNLVQGTLRIDLWRRLWRPRLGN